MQWRYSSQAENEYLTLTSKKRRAMIIMGRMMNRRLAILDLKREWRSEGLSLKE